MFVAALGLASLMVLVVLAHKQRKVQRLDVLSFRTYRMVCAAAFFAEAQRNTKNSIVKTTNPFGISVIHQPLPAGE